MNMSVTRYKVQHMHGDTFDGVPIGLEKEKIHQIPGLQTSKVGWLEEPPKTTLGLLQ